MTTKEMIYRNHFNLKTDVENTLTSLFLDLVLLTLRLLFLTPVLAPLPFLPSEEDVFFLLTFLRFPVQSIIKKLFPTKTQRLC